MYIIFPSAFRKGRQLEDATLGRDKHWPCWNGDPSRIFVRKAGYNYGWDWGPTLMTGACAHPVLTRIHGADPPACIQPDPSDPFALNNTRSGLLICTCYTSCESATE